MNFKMVNAKKLNDGIKKKYLIMAFLFTEILIISWHTEM